MRGDLDDALARLARRDQLHKRVNQGTDRATSAAEELAAAVRQVVERHPGLAAVVRLTDGDQSVDLSVSHHGGRVEVRIAGPTTAGPATAGPATPANRRTGDGPRHGHNERRDTGTGAPTVITGTFSEPPAVGVPTAGGPPDWPPRAEPPAGSPAARLAELIRQDPSLLGGTADG